MRQVAPAAPDHRRAWAEVWGATMVSVEPGKPMHPFVDRWWSDELLALGPFGRALEIGAGASAQAARAAARLAPEALVVACDFRELQRQQQARVVGAAMERLPFADETFDVVLSQFAFEYAEREGAIAEIWRVLRSGGSVRLLMHSPETAYADYVHHRIVCFGMGVDLARAMAARRTGEALAKLRLKQTVRRLAELAARYEGETPYPKIAADLSEFLSIGQRAVSGRASADPEGDAALLAACGPALDLARAQARATLGPQEMSALMQRFGAQGFMEPSYGALAGPRDCPLGWTVRLRKP